jgi:hypothetical protein
MIWLYIAGATLILHGLIELAPLLLKSNKNPQNESRGPKFIFEPLQNNLKVTIILGEIFGAIRIIAAIGILVNLMWGWALGIIISIVTFVVMTLYLPMGIMDGILSGITLISLLVAYWGSTPIL